MQISDFDYLLPEELIAQKPLPERDAARMMLVNRSKQSVEHRHFRDLPDYLDAGDVLIFNESKVIYARLLGVRPSGGKVEIFLLRKLEGSRCECLIRTSSSQKKDLEFIIGESLRGRVIEQIPESISYLVEFYLQPGRDLDSYLEELGHVPLPPYIKREDSGLDKQRYQTVYAKRSGSVAAPTAGLHYTEETLGRLRAKGIGVGFVELHVGLGTFQPIKVDRVEDHRMHKELFNVPEATVRLVRTARLKGKKVIAVGTTSARSLESAARGMEVETELYLYPGCGFEWITGLHTNFHQPKSSLLVMLAAFMGKDLLFRAYDEAKREKYRFLSYGDCMLVL